MTEGGCGKMKAKRSVKGMLISACVLRVMVVSVILGGIAIWGIKSSTSMAIEEYKTAMNDGYNSEIKSEVQSVIHVLNTVRQSAERRDHRGRGKGKCQRDRPRYALP